MQSSRLLELARIANDVRIGALTAVYSAGCGHPGGSLSIADIAAATGFDDSSYFTRKFKEQYYISPSALRESGAAEQANKEEIL